MWGILLAALAQQVEFKPRADVGAILRVELKAELELDVISVDREQPARKVSVASQLQEVFQQEITEAAGGQAVRASITCERSVWERREKDAPSSGPVPTDRQGKSFELHRGAAGGALTKAGKRADPEDAHVGRWEDVAGLLPTGKVGQGDRWKKPAEALSFLVSGGAAARTTGELDCTLTRVEGDRATIEFAGTIGRAPTEQETVSLRLNGSLVFNVATGRPESLGVGGDLAIDRAILTRERRPEEGDELYPVQAGTLVVRSRKWQASLKFSAP
jgi:hypothetical protein